jgi:signal transduction histidine kinase
MSLVIVCPSCGNRGELPPGTTREVVLTCRNCQVRFSPKEEPAPKPVTEVMVPETNLDLGVWVGDGPTAPLESSTRDDVLIGPHIAPKSIEIDIHNAAGHLEWLRAETVRFNAYVQRQLVALVKMRENVASYEAKVQVDTVTREQALNRERTILETRAAELAKRETDLAAALTRQGDDLAAELGQLVAAERENLAKRAEKLESLERTLQVRIHEVEELEQSLRRELDERETAVERQRRVLEDVAQELRTRTPPPGSGGGVGATEVELDLS